MPILHQAYTIVIIVACLKRLVHWSKRLIIPSNAAFPNINKRENIVRIQA